MNNWVMHGGSFLGTQKQLPDKSMPEVAAVLAKFNIHAILLVGGFEVFQLLVCVRVCCIRWYF